MVTNKKFAVRNFVYFCMNFPHDFIKKVWEGKQLEIDHYTKKWDAAYKKHATGALPFFFVELDSENQDLFSE